MLPLACGDDAPSVDPGLMADDDTDAGADDDMDDADDDADDAVDDDVVPIGDDDDDVLTMPDGGGDRPAPMDAGDDDDQPMMDASVVDAGIADSGTMEDAGMIVDAGPEVDASLPPAPVTISSIARGDFALLPGYTAPPLPVPTVDGGADAGPPQPGPLPTVSGAAMLIRMSNGTTTVMVEVAGLTPSTAYPAHVHAGPCSANGLGHYKLDPTEAATLEANEIWPLFTTDVDGKGSAEVIADHLARGDALSVVIHDPEQANAKMACADLKYTDPPSVVASGDFAPFAAAELGDESIAGSATLTRTRNGATIQVNVTGLDPNESYATHLHSLPCEVDNAGSHYKIDPLIATTEESNEIWPSVVPVADGSSSYQATLTHRPREDAQSIVIHRQVIVDGGVASAPKVACANLERMTFPTSTSSATGSLLADGQIRTPTMLPRASLTRGLDGRTTVTLNVFNSVPDTMHAVHVHDSPCSVNDGGAHYKIDRSITDTLESNEIWVPITTSANGAATDVVIVQHLARPDAQSLVIHDPTDGARLACIDFD